MELFDDIWNCILLIVELLDDIWACILIGVELLDESLGPILLEVELFEDIKQPKSKPQGKQAECLVSPINVSLHSQICLSLYFLPTQVYSARANTAAKASI